MNKSLEGDCKQTSRRKASACRGGGLLPNDTGSWEVANSDICVAIAGLADRPLALVLGLGTGKKRRKKGGRNGEKERGQGGRRKWRVACGLSKDGTDSRPESLAIPPGNSLWICGCWDEKFSQSCQYPLKVQSVPGPVPNRGKATFGKLDFSQREPFSKKP